MNSLCQFPTYSVEFQHTLLKSYSGRNYVVQWPRLRRAKQTLEVLLMILDHEEALALSIFRSLTPENQKILLDLSRVLRQLQEEYDGSAH